MMRTVSLIALALLALVLAGCNLSTGDDDELTNPILTIEVGDTTPAPDAGNEVESPPVEGEAPPASDAVPFVTITTPAPNADGTPVIVDPAGFTVAGELQGSFENNLIVQALDVQGNVLQEQVTTATSGEIGARAAWEVQLAPQVVAGSAGTIYAYFTSPQDGSVVASATLPVVYGPA
ncbi:MAG: hypothetical protein GXY36_19460 [Chloroflexi bacterium]|nr:hypothetical protein [Chloroflexota bacterium]